jgi:formamidopyrimidine-DNA glycosylase
MPELPEVEVVRRGLERWVVGRTVKAVQVAHPRAVRRHPAGAQDFAAVLDGRTVRSALRRGKYLWLPFSAADSTEMPDHAVVGHLGMSGQLLIQPAGTADEKHLRVRFSFDDQGTELRFVDQRTFGGLHAEPLNADGLPVSIAHIARDPLDPLFDEDAFHKALRKRTTELKRALLDQSLISGIGNIYADEALWRSKLHGARNTATMTRAQTATVVTHAREVMTDALAVGGTSFDSLYVNVNGESGYFSRALDAYGRGGLPCSRCGGAIRRISFMSRSSYFCGVCQKAPRRA